jgi:hypothetical protein
MILLFLSSFFSRVLQKIVFRLLKHPYADPFRQPVDPDSEDIPDYFTIVKNPMDLGTIRKNLENSLYDANPLQCLRDINLVWENCYRYNPPNSEVSKKAQQLQKSFIHHVRASHTFAPDEVAFLQETNPHMFTSTSPSPTCPSPKPGVPEHVPRLDDYLERFPGDTKKLTHREKLELFCKLRRTPEHVQAVVVKIIQLLSPHTARFDGTTIPYFDLDLLDTRVLRYIEYYLNEYLRKNPVPQQLFEDHVSPPLPPHPPPSVLSASFPGHPTSGTSPQTIYTFSPLPGLSSPLSALSSPSSRMPAAPVSSLPSHGGLLSLHSTPPSLPPHSFFLSSPSSLASHMTTPGLPSVVPPSSYPIPSHDQSSTPGQVP